ncbi:hypothetical protein ACFE04_026847 [Oxalis oulophora]
MASADAEYRCFVGGLAWATDDQALESAFSKYGEVVESKIINDRETGRSRGFGFVTFKDQDSMTAAIDGMNGQQLDGRNITGLRQQLEELGLFVCDDDSGLGLVESSILIGVGLCDVAGCGGSGGEDGRRRRI